MRAEEWLLNIRGIDDDIRGLKESLQRHLEIATSTTSSTTIEKVAGTPKNAKEEALAEASDLSMQLAEIIEMKRKLQIDAFWLIERVGNKNQRMLLRMYYIDGLTWADVAERLNMSVRYVSGDLKKKAIEKIEILRGQAPED